MRLLLVLTISTCAFAQTVATPPQPPTQVDRLKWATFATAGFPSLTAGIFTAGISTAQNDPIEYGPHWDGYFKRQALRLAGASTSNFMEAELGALWGEDPRYRRSGVGSVKHRIAHALKTSVLAYDRQGNTMPAYARFIAIPTSNIIGNTWRPDSQRTAGETATRVSLGFLSRMAANTFAEFWPDIQSKIFKKK